MIVDYIAVGRAVLGATPTLQRLVLERFFDETGGMQLVIHSPYGGRLNRAFGLALRKKFCRTFNFELQAAASDDAIVLSLGPHHSFPLDEVARYVHSNTVEETLEQAVLDAPMFLSRWRWNLNRSLLVLRFRGGRRNPPPIQRMEADDLMAALFPQAAACQENVTGPIEIPDHVIVRQTVYDTLHEALDVDGLRTLLQHIESGDGQRAHGRHDRAVGARARDPHRAPVRVPRRRGAAEPADERGQLRRGLSVDLASIGRLDPEAIARVHDEITPGPEHSDDLHDLLCSLVMTKPRPEWAALWDELVARGRGQVLESGHGALWCATETLDEARPRVRRRRRRGRRGRTRPARARRHRHRPSGWPLRARCRPAGSRTRSRSSNARAWRSRAPTADPTSGVEWVARRLLARMHAYSRRSRRRAHRARDRAGLHALPPPVATPRSRHPALRRRGPRDRRRPAARLGGGRGRMGTGAPGSSPAPPRDRGARPAVSRRRDRLAAAQPAPRATWTRPPVRRTRRPRSRWCSATTSHWLLEAARGGTDPLEPTAGATAEIVEHLREQGACFATELGQATNRLPEDVERALWDGVSRGLLTSDGFGAIRARVDKGTRSASTGSIAPGSRA